MHSIWVLGLRKILAKGMMGTNWKTICNKDKVNSYLRTIKMWVYNFVEEVQYLKDKVYSCLQNKRQWARASGRWFWALRKPCKWHWWIPTGALSQWLSSWWSSDLTSKPLSFHVWTFLWALIRTGMMPVKWCS